MKVFISADLEGVACVVHIKETSLEGEEYQRARKWMTAEANAAAEAAFEAGATEVYLADGHGENRNIIPDDLRQDVILVRGAPRVLAMMAGIDSTFSAAMFIGYHAQAGTEPGLLAHTNMGSVYSLRVNGAPMGELGFNAAIAGYFGVPAVLVSGDDSLVAEAKGLMPWAECVTTKQTLSPWAASCMTPKAAQSKIRAAVTHAMGRLSTMKPLVLPRPIRVETDLLKVRTALVAADIPGVERVGARTVAFTAQDMLEASRMWRLLLNIDSLATSV